MLTKLTPIRGNLLKVASYSIHFLHSIPYQFNGFPLDSSIILTEQSHITKSFLRMIDPHTEKGLIYAYSNLLEALQEMDIAFLKANLEPLLFKSIAEYPDLLKKENKSLKIANEESKIHVDFSEFTLVFGVDFEREKNPKNLYKKQLKRNNGTFSYDIYGPDPDVGNVVSLMRGINTGIPPIMQIPVYFKSERQLQLIESPQETSSSPSNTETKEIYHKVVFENVGSFDIKLTLGKFLWSIIRKGRNVVILETIRALFSQPNALWRISDIDDFMSGNEFLRN